MQITAEKSITFDTETDAEARKKRAVQDQEIQQNGWLIDYLAYGEDGALPTRLRLTYPGLEIRLAINDWHTRP